MNIPENLLDDEGYPTEEIIEFITKYEPNEDIEDFAELIRSIWWCKGWGFRKYRYKGRTKLELHTGGWSGNEEIMSAIESNRILGLFLRKTM